MKCYLQLIVVLLLLSCTKEDNTVTPQQTQPKAIYYLEANVNNEPFKAEYHHQSGFNFFVGWNDTFVDNQGCLISYKSGLYKKDNSIPEIQVVFSNFFKQQDSGNCTTDEYDKFDTCFTEGTEVYADGFFSKGMLIEYVDKKNDSTTYISDLDRAKDFNFKINDVELKDCGDSKCAVVQGEFDCIAVDKNNPDNEKEIHITEGKFKLLFQSRYP